MYKSLRISTGEEIVILDSRWRGQIDQLRAWDQEDALVCPGCEQPVRLRAGAVKRWHFAHKHLQNCPYALESPELLEARAVLYDWLVLRFGETSVTVEQRLEGLPRPMDCWVRRDTNPVAYWLFDTRLAPDVRESLQAGFTQSAAQVRPVFLANMLHEEPLMIDHLYLTTTEREFRQASALDEGTAMPGAEPPASLHYLDTQNQALTTFRGLRLVHPPQLFTGRKYHNPLDVVTVDPGSGEFMHPGESQRLQKLHRAQEARQRVQEEQERRAAEKLQSLLGSTSLAPGPVANAPSGVDSQPRPAPGRARASFEFKEPDANLPAPVCIFCGKQTEDYWYVNRKENTCKCRECYRAGKY